jgi:hypothetical protein
MQKIFVLGHSHIGALSSSYGATRPAGLEMEFLGLHNPLFEPPLQDGVLHPAIATRLRQANAGLYLALIGGNEHAAMSLLNHPRRFDVVLPEAPALPVQPGAELLPATLALALLEQWSLAHVQLLAACRAVIPGRLVYIEPPPPVPSAAHIHKYPDTFGEAVAAHGVSPALVRYKFWRLQSQFWRGTCARLGVEFMTVPAEMCDADGMLAEAAWNPDPTHGNAVYGGAVIAKLLREAA